MAGTLNGQSETGCFPWNRCWDEDLYRWLIGKLFSEATLQGGKQDWQREVNTIAGTVQASTNPRVALRLEWFFRDDPSRVKGPHLHAVSGPVVGYSHKKGNNFGWGSLVQPKAIFHISSFIQKTKALKLNRRLWVPSCRWPHAFDGTSEDRYRFAWSKFCWPCFHPRAIQAFTEVLGFCPKLFYMQAEWLQPTSPDYKCVYPKSQFPALLTSVPTP